MTCRNQLHRELNGAGWLGMSEKDRQMWRNTIAREMDRVNDDDWRDRPLAGTGILFAVALGIAISAVALWIWGVL